jgi:hypothetical protein
MKHMHVLSMDDCEHGPEGVNADAHTSVHDPFFFSGQGHAETNLCTTSTNQHEAPGQDTGRSQGHLSSYFEGGAPRERHRAICKTDSKLCDTHGGELHEHQTQTLIRTGQETHRATPGKPGQTGNATITKNQRSCTP